MWAKLAAARRFIGNLWGQTTTHLLALAVGLQGVISNIDPGLLPPSPWYVHWLPTEFAALVVVLRWLCPPPPALPVHPEDTVHMTPTGDGVLVTVAKADPTTVPAAVQQMAGS